jgi:hypothetical protein
MTTEGANGNAAASETVDVGLSRLIQGNVQEPPPLEGSLLPAVQAHIRHQTRGRYFGEKRRSYRDPTLLLLGSATLLLILAAAFLGLFESLLR